jgi:hypothetical protein
MRILLVAILVSLSMSGIAAPQARPDFSGTWTLPPDAPPGPNGKPVPAPGYGPTINIRQDAGTITISRFIGGATVHVTHPLDGTESRSRAHGRLCEGESQAIWTAAWQGDAILTTMVGSQSPGAETPTKMDVKAVFSLRSPDTLAVEMTYQTRGAAEPRRVTTLYRRSGPPSEVPPPVGAAPFEARIGQIDWLSGTWIGTSGTSTFEERWTPPAGGSMLAVARTIRSGLMFGFEFLCIVERSGGLVYQAMPNGRQPATDFTLTHMEGKSLTFENPAHDFPKKIRYTLSADGVLEAVISGDEKQKPQTFRFTKR